MANAVEKANTIAIASIQAINGITDANLQALNGLEFTGYNPTEAHTLIATATASGSATLEFTSGIDSTYDEYEFRFTNMHPASNDVEFSVQFNTGYNRTITSTFFEAYLREDNGNAALTYRDTMDQHQGSGYQPLTRDTSNLGDSSVSGVFTLYAPSSTTYVKQFVSRTHEMQKQSSYAAYSRESNAAGYVNTTAAVDKISFKFSSGNIDAGQIKMYGIAKA